jgi:hypothetical protein
MTGEYGRQLQLQNEIWRRQARRDLVSWCIEAQAWARRIPARHTGA